MRTLLLVGLVACGGSETTIPDARCEGAVLYLNRTGADYAHGLRDDSSLNVSELIDVPRTLPPWPHDDIDWGFLTECIRTRLAPFPVEVTETDPGARPHTEVVFTTAYWAGSPGTTNIVPDACRTGHEVEFVFGNALPTFARACHVTLRGYAQMTALLSIADNCEDILNADMDCSLERTFTDRESTCVDGSAQPTPCRCGGAATQNSFSAMQAALTCP
jgi:hypothetical protein